MSGLPGIGTFGRHQGRSADYWDLEWTFTDGSGAVLIDSTQSCLETRVATPVADGGTGITNVAFPKCRRAWVVHCSLEPPTGDLGDGTDVRLCVVTEVVATSGTCNVRFFDVEGSGNLVDPTSGARCRLTLRLEFS